MTRYVALYCRISKDKRGRLEGVDAQERWGREYAAETWPGVPVRVFADNNISAANGDHRPEFEALREAVLRGEVAHLWSVEQSRLERREAEWFQIAAELDAAGLAELHTNRDGIVRVRDEVAGIKAVLNAGEVRKMKKRVHDRLAEIAAQGRPSGSRPFGYAHGVDASGGKTYVIIPEQAEVIRWAADKVLSGWALTNIAAELRARGVHGAHRLKVKDENGEVVTNERGEPVTRPSTISPASVRSMVTNPAVAGYRVHRGEVTGRGVWEPILADDVWRAVRAKLSTPRVVRRKDGLGYPVGEAHVGNVAGRKYTLTGGLACCGVCEAPLTGSVKQLRSAKSMRLKPYLTCTPNLGGKSCVGIMLPETEKYVADRLFAELDKPEFLDALGMDDQTQRRDEIAAKLDDVENQRGQLARMWAARELTLAEWQSARAELAAQERELRRDLATLPPPRKSVDIAAAREAWDDGMALDEQREFLRLFIDRVAIKRAKPGTKGFDSDRVAIEWRRAA